MVDFTGFYHCMLADSQIQNFRKFCLNIDISKKEKASQLSLEVHLANCKHSELPTQMSERIVGSCSHNSADSCRHRLLTIHKKSDIIHESCFKNRHPVLLETFSRPANSYANLPCPFPFFASPGVRAADHQRQLLHTPHKMSISRNNPD